MSPVFDVFFLLSPFFGLRGATCPATLIFHFHPCRKEGRRREVVAKGGSFLPTYSPSPFPCFVCKLLGRQCSLAALLGLEKALERPVQRTVAQRRGWGGKNRTSWTSCPFIPAPESKPSWAVGQGTSSLP